jgi:NADH-quinone oxidoreductase subunit M
MDHWILTLMVFVPLLGAAVVLCLPSGAKDAIRWTATAFTVPPVILSVWLLRHFDPAAGFQFIDRVSWIPAYHIEYFVGDDGLSITMVVLTALLSFLCMIASFGIEKALRATSRSSSSLDP